MGSKATQQLKHGLKSGGRFCLYSLARLLRSLPFSSEVLGPPRGCWPSLAAAVQASSNETASSYEEIHPPEQVQLTEPIAVQPCPQAQLSARRSFMPDCKAAFVAVLPQGRVWSHNGYVISADDRLVTEVSRDFAYRWTPWVPESEKNSIFRQLYLGDVIERPETLAVLAVAAQSVYYHWMFDLLPRIELIRRSQVGLASIDRFVLGKLTQKFQTETLNILGISQEKILEIPSDRPVQVKVNQLVVPSVWSHEGCIPLWICNFLRQTFIPQPGQSTQRRLIYISRARASHRRVLNEAELLQFLEGFGFEPVVLEQLSVVEQAQLFSSADIIVAPHGAGLTNLVFCQPGTRVIEFFVPSYVNLGYWSLSSQLQLQHYYFFAQEVTAPDQRTPHLTDIFVNLRDLDRALTLADVAPSTQRQACLEI